MARKRGKSRPRAKSGPEPAGVNGSPTPSFDRIYLDSEPLIGARWPRISTALDNVLRHARALGINVFLPAATEKELEAHWLREAHQLTGKIDTHMRGVVDAHRYSFPDLESLRAIYQEKVAAVKEQYDLLPAPMPRRSLSEVFEHWVAGSITVQRKVAFLKDTTIYQSVIEHLQAEAGHVGAFVSKDTDFDEEFMKRLTPAGVQVVPFAGLAPLLVVLQRGLRADVKQRIDEDQRRAREAIARHPDLETFINENLEVPEDFLPYPRIVALRRANVVGVVGALTTHLEEEQPTGRVSISAQVAVQLHLLVEPPITTPAARTLKAGEALPASYWRGLPAPVPAEPEERVEQALVSVEATAILRNGNYEDVQLASASLISPLFARLFTKEPKWTNPPE